MESNPDQEIFPKSSFKFHFIQDSGRCDCQPSRCLIAIQDNLGLGLEEKGPEVHNSTASFKDKTWGSRSGVPNTGPWTDTVRSMPEIGLRKQAKPHRRDASRMQNHILSGLRKNLSLSPEPVPAPQKIRGSRV